MIVYRDQRRRVPVCEVLERVEASSGEERRIELGELEAGVADALCPDCDHDLPVLAALRRGEWRGVQLPSEIEISVPEGFAYYAVDPELYRRAAACFARTERPRRVAVIGVRSIGTTLSGIVASELHAHGCEVQSWTVRPRGHPWKRELRIAGDLAETWRSWDGMFAVVDEGPGLSGSSFASVSVYLESLGIAAARVVLFPSWLPDGTGFVSPEAGARWRMHRKYSVPFEELNLFPGACDLSAGKWRELRGIDPPVYPAHERRKYLRDGCLHKFAGYGRYGRAARDRAGALTGWTPRCGGLERGFLRIEWHSSAPSVQDTADESFLNFAAQYLAFVLRTFPVNRPIDFDLLAEMIAVNVPGAPDVNGSRSAVLDGCSVALDARMFPHEWIRTDGGYLKTDALDHHDDHFFPGPQDTAWDVAGFGIECNLDAGAAAYFLECYERASDDRGIRSRLPFYRLAYLAFRLGYTSMFDCGAERYRKLLESWHE